VRSGDGKAYSFEVDAFRKERMLQGLDEIGTTLKQADKIRAFEAERLARHPWLNVEPIGAIR